MEKNYADYILDTKKASIDREQKWVNFEQQLLSFNEIISETVIKNKSNSLLYILQLSDRQWTKYNTKSNSY